LRDPDPKKTRILNRPDPTATQPLTQNLPILASRTSVSYRVEPLYGGFVGYEGSRWGLEVRGLTNRDLDASYEFSFITTATLQPVEKAQLSLSWIHDSYSDVSSFPGKSGNVLWGSGRYWVLPSLAVGGGVKWVNNPSPQSTTNPGWRNSVTLLLNLEYRTSVF